MLVLSRRLGERIGIKLSPAIQVIAQSQIHRRAELFNAGYAAVDCRELGRPFLGRRVM